jgi:Protein of unknown function (DUF998)
MSRLTRLLRFSLSFSRARLADPEFIVDQSKQRGETDMTNTTSRDDTKLTKTLLLAGMVAGPLYVGVGLIEGMTRRGFSFLHHDLSVLANGNLGWIHSTLLVTTGLLSIVGAIGMRRVLHGRKGGTWGPILLGVYGLGLIGAGFFKADPANGFPPGTPADYHEVSTSGLLHLIFGSIGFLCLIASCFVLARYFKSAGQPTWSKFSVFTGIFYFLAFFGIAMGSQKGGTIETLVILGFSAAVIVGWTWISLTLSRLRKELI